MKHYVHLIIYSACISAIVLLSACRSSYRHTKQLRENQSIQESNSELHTSTGTIASQVRTNQEELGKSWKITYHFDNTSPVNPTTGLPAVSSIEIEGSEKQIKAMQTSIDSVHTSSSSTTKGSLNATANQESDTDIDGSHKAATGIDDGLKHGLTVGIPLFIFIIALSYYAKRQNTQK